MLLFLPLLLLSAVVGEDPPSTRCHKVEDVASSRLLLTPLVQAGKGCTARRLSKVKSAIFPRDVPSYSGYFTVNYRHDSNLFFWFFPAKNNPQKRPLLLWLQGGPGASSLYGLFTEIGPFSFHSSSKKLVRNPYSWHYNHSLLFIDNPVGTGFSYTNPEGYATNMTQIADELYEALRQFFVVFPRYRKRDFYLAGESFGGKHVPALSRRILEGNINDKRPIKLKGLLIGNGLIDPENMQSYSEFLFSLGMISHENRDVLRRQQRKTVRAIQQAKYTEAFEALENCWIVMYRNLWVILNWSRTLDLITDYTCILSKYNFLLDIQFKGNSSHQNCLYLRDQYFYGDGPFAGFVKSDPVRAAIHVGDEKFVSPRIHVYEKLLPCIMETARPWIEQALDAGVKVLSYSGQLDVIVAYALSVESYRRFNFTGAEEYLRAKRRPWYVDGRLMGYIRSGGNFTEVLVRGAGHMVPADKPAAGLALVEQLTINSYS